ncbi:heat shock factor-binding protein [Telopea speciosissima]|uniref:heat shock factor-binding protein n=1 Tax=Telopea speciosissima TaxID=54955 RepID=UPI001CC5F4C4|nr:heat shock factor-binding protein [Telopea speciosissima]
MTSFIRFFPASMRSSASTVSEKQITGRENMDGQDSDDSKQSTADMTVFVQNLLQQMQSRFQAMSESIVSKIDDMGQRIDDLEQNINELRNEMGTEGSPSPVAPTKAKSEDTKPSDVTP